MKKSTTHKFNVSIISEHHQSQSGGSVHADFSLLGQKWAESGILLFIQYIWLCQRIRGVIAKTRYINVLTYLLTYISSTLGCANFGPEWPLLF